MGPSLDDSYEASDPGSVVAWWDCTQQLITKRCTEPRPKIVFADINARIRRSHPGVSGGDIDPPGAAGIDGEIVLQFAQEIGRVIVNIFEQYNKEGAGLGTFQLSRKAPLVRCDYFMVDSNTVVGPGSTYAWHNFHMHAQKADHIPLVSSINVTVSPQYPVAARRVAPYDRKAVANAKVSKDPEVISKREALRAHVLDRPTVHSTVEPTSHSFIANGHMLEGPEKFFPRPRRAQKQEYLTEGTMDMVHMKAAMIHHLTTLGNQIARACLCFVLRFWKATASPQKFRHMKPKWYPARGPVTPNQCMRQLVEREELARYTIMVQDSVTKDFAAHAAFKAGLLIDAVMENNSQEIYRLLKAMKPWAPRRQFRLNDAEGRQLHRGEEDR